MGLTPTVTRPAHAHRHPRLRSRDTATARPKSGAAHGTCKAAGRPGTRPHLRGAKTEHRRLVGLARWLKGKERPRALEHGSELWRQAQQIHAQHERRRHKQAWQGEKEKAWSGGSPTGSWGSRRGRKGSWPWRCGAEQAGSVSWFVSRSSWYSTSSRCRAVPLDGDVVVDAAAVQLLSAAASGRRGRRGPRLLGAGRRSRGVGPRC
jgi:hypothetical protein